MRFSTRDWLMATAMLSLHANLVIVGYQDIEAAFGPTDLGFAIVLPAWVLAHFFLILRLRRAGQIFCSFLFPQWWWAAWISMVAIDADLLFASFVEATPFPLGIWRHVLLILALVWSRQAHTLSICRFGITFHCTYWPWEKLHTILCRRDGIDYLVLDPTYSQLAQHILLPLHDPLLKPKLQRQRAAAVMASLKSDHR